MTDDEKAARVRLAIRSVEVVVCESCDDAIDTAMFDFRSEAEEFARAHLRENGQVLCVWCADPKNAERMLAAAAKLREQAEEARRRTGAVGEAVARGAG